MANPERINRFFASRTQLVIIPFRMKSCSSLPAFCEFRHDHSLCSVINLIISDYLLSIHSNTLYIYSSQTGLATVFRLSIRSDCPATTFFLAVWV